MRKYNFSGKNSAQSSAVAPLYITKQQKEQNVGGFLGGIGYLGEKLATGFFQSLEGISDYTLGGFAKLFGADDWAEEQFENDWFGDWYTHPDEWYNPSEGWKVAGDVAGGIGTSLPSLAAGATAAGITILSGGTAAPLAAGLASAATAGLGAAGTGTKEAYKKTGQLGGKEFGYGALSGLVEGATEGVTNALTLGTGTVLKNITKSFGKEITQTVAKQSAVKGLLGGFLGEAFEEGLSEWVNPYIARITYDSDAENATAQEIFYSALIGGLSGMVMSGVNIAADTSNSFAKGAKIANSGREGEVLGLSRNLAAFQNENATENEAFRAVADTYKTLSESLALTGGKITTAAQKKQLGDLSRANVSAVFSPMITRSAANIYANAEAIADALGTYGYKDADGKPMSFTADQIREGIDPTNKKSLARALKTNTVLRTLAVADVTGQMMMDTQKFRDATLAGKNLARRADLWRFAEEATPDEIRSVSEALGIDNWETLTEDDFADKITTFLRDGGAKRYADLRAESERIFADESEAAALPTLIALEDGQTRKYKTGEDTVAIARKGEGYRIFDYGTRQTSREMSRAEVNKALADNNLRGQAISARMQEYAEKTAEIKRKTQETDAWARENTKGYAELSAPNKTMIRKVIRSAKENGIADEDIKTYSSISAHSGVDIVFSKRLAKVDGGYADAFYDPKKNRIVVNPEATRSAEKILLHELDHAIRTGIRKDGGTKLFADALFGISDEAMEKITARYKDMESDVSTNELIADEANAYFAETVFADKKVLEQLTEKVPTLKERIISFLEGAVTSYAGEPKLEGAAKRYLKQYKKMFAEFAERNAGNNAEDLTRINPEKAHVSGRRYALPEEDSDGNELSEAQREYFAESKVLRGGKLLPLYHQTSADFTVFDTAREGAGARDNETPHGIFLKPMAENIGLKGNKQMKLYANITNPLVLMNRSSAAYYWKKNIDGYADIISQIAENDRKYEALWEEADDVEKLAKRKNLDFSKLSRKEKGALYAESTEESEKIIEEWGKANTVLDKKAKALIDKYLKDNGFDGMFLKEDIGSFGRKVETYIALSPEQVKNADNENPTSDPDIRYALPLDEDALAAVDALLESEDIKPASVIDRFVPTADGSKRMERYSRADAMKTISKFPHIDALSDAKYKQLITAMYDGMSKAETMDAKIDFARGFAQAFITDLTDARETRSDYSKAVETKQKLAVGLQKLTFSKEEINELMHLLGEDEARAFMKRWGRKKTNVKYPIDVFLGDIQTAAPEFTSNIDGKAPVDALIEIDRIYTDAKERAKSKYVYPYREMTDTERAMLEDKVFKGIMTGFAAADKEITAQAMKGAAEEATYFQAKLDEQTATDREFREAQQAEFDKKAKNLNERNRENKEYYGTQTKLAKIAQKGAEVTAKEAKKQAETAKKAQANAEERAAKAEARAEKQIEAEEARADRVIEAYEKKAAVKIERAEEKLKKARERTESVKAELAENKKLLADRERGYSLRASIGARVQKLTEMKKGTFENATTWGADNFKKILSTLSSVEWQKNFSAKKAISAMQTMNKWYKPTNTLLGYIDNTNTGLYNTEMAGTIAALAALDETSMLDTENLKSLDEVLGYFTKLIESYNKVFYRGKWVEAKPIAEGFISAAKQSGRALPGWVKAKMHGYLQTFGDTASVVRFYDGYLPGGFWTAMFDTMREGGIEAEIEIARIMRDYEAFMKKHPKFLAEAEKATVKFMGVEMPKMEAIALFMTMKRDHSHKGLTASGFQYDTAKGENIDIKGFAPEVARDPYAGMTLEERLEQERKDANANDSEYKKTRDDARNKAADLRAELKQAKKELAEYSTLQDTPDAVELKSALEGYIETLEESLKEQTAIAQEYDTALKDEKEKLKLFREISKAERAKAMLDVVEAKRRKLEAKLTESDLEYIKILEAGFTECGNLKESRDLEKYGFTNVTGGYYFPLLRANTAGSIDIDFASELDRVSNASFNKDTVQGAAGKLHIGNADAIFRTHVKAVCQYYALSPAIDTYDRIYNMDVSGNPNDPTSVRTTTRNTWRDGNEFMRDLMGDIQGVPRKRGKSAKTFDKMRGGYAKFQLGLNVKTWLGQFSSGFAAMSILDYSSTVKATVSGKKISRDVDTYCDLAKLRNAENTAAMAQGASLPGRIYGKMAKFSDLMMAPMGRIDRLVVTSEFAVCQAQVAKNGGPAIGTEQNRVAAGKLLEKVILETQQNTLATERSAAMRSGSEIYRTLTMFSADSMKVFGRVIDSFGEVAAIKNRIAAAEKSLLDSAGEDKAKRKQIAEMIAEAEKADKSKKADTAEVAEADTTGAEIKQITEMKKALAKAKRKKRKSIGALVASSIYMAFVAQFLRHLFDKEEDDEELETVLPMMLLDTGGNLIGGLPIIRDVYSYAADGFGVEDLSLSAMNDLLSLSGQLISYGEKFFTGEAKTQDTMRLSRNALYALAQTVGLPTRNLDNLVKAFNKRLLPETAYRVDEWFYEKNYKNDLYKAIEDGDIRMTEFLLSLATGERIGTTLSETAHEELCRLISAGYNVLPREVGKTITVDGTEYEMSEEEREMVREAYATATDKLDKLFANRAYSRLSEEEKTEAIRYVYNTAYNAALADVYGIDRGNAAIIAETVGYDTAATLYIRTKGIESDKGKDGKTIAGTKRKKTVAAINSMPISTEKKLFLICAKGYALADGDVKGLTAEAAKKRLLHYIVNLPGKTKNEKAMLAEMCGFAVKNGKISLKNSA